MVLHARAQSMLISTVKMEASENSESLSTHLAEQPMTKENSNLSVSPSSHTQLTSSGQKPRLKIGLAGRGRGRGGIARGRSSLKGFAKNDQETRPGGSLADASLDPTNPWPYSQGDSPRPGGSVGRMADHVELSKSNCVFTVIIIWQEYFRHLCS